MKSYKFILTGLFLLALISGCNKKEASSVSGSNAAVTNAPKIDPGTAATITGKVSFYGEAPKAEQIDMSQDPGCIIGNAEPNFSQAYLVDNGGLQNVYVYVKEASNDLTKMRFEPPKETAILEQRGCRYFPHVLSIMADQKLQIVNSDPTDHNVHPAPSINEGWNISQTPKSAPIEKTFPNPEVMIPVKCNQHPWMKMFLNVATHPFYSITGKDGRFEIKGLPPGEYTIAAVHERMGEKTQQITVGAHESKALDFGFHSDDAKNAPPSR